MIVTTTTLSSTGNNPVLTAMLRSSGIPIIIKKKEVIHGVEADPIMIVEAPAMTKLILERGDYPNVSI